MKVKNSTGKALSLSILSTFLCVCMLFGMTYAWFKVEIDSGNNTIKIGAFEAKVYYSTTYIAADANGWTDFQGANVFSDVTLIPGDEVVRYVKFENKCDYPVKFDLVLPTGATFDANGKVNNLNIYTADTVTAAVTVADMVSLNNLGALHSAATAAAPTLLVTKTLVANTSAVVAVGVKLPETYDSVSAQAISETFKLRVIATQWNVEHYESTTNVPASEAGTTKTFRADDYSVTVPNAEAGNYDLKVVDKGTTTSATETVIDYDISLLKDNQPVTSSTEDLKVTIDIGPGKTITSVKHNGVEVENWDYTNGIITFYTSHFSPFSVTFEELEGAVYVSNSAELHEAFNEGAEKIVLLNDISATTTMASNDNRFNYWIKNNTTVYGNGHTLTVKARGIGIQGVSENIDVAFKGITITNVGSINGRCIDTRGKLNSLTLETTKLTTKDSTYTGYLQPLTIGGNQSTATTVVINNSTIEVNEAANKGYAITTFNPVNMTITDSTLKGWACLNIKGPDSSAGSSGSVIIANDSKFISVNQYSGETNSFGVVKLEDVDLTFFFNNSEFDIDTTGDQKQSIACFKGNVAKNATFILKDCTADFKGLGIFEENLSFAENSSFTIISGTYNLDPSAYLDSESNATESNGIWTVTGTKEIVIGGGQNAGNTPGPNPSIPGSSAAVSSGSLPELITP